MEALIEQCTSEKNAQDQWDLILRICEEYGSKEPKACLKAIGKRLFHKNPNVSLRAVTLLDACSKNCGKTFNRELASRDFSQLVKRSFAHLQRIPSVKLVEVFEKWAEEFKSDSELALAASLYSWVKSEHYDVIRHLHEDRQAAKAGPSRQNAAKLQAKEEEELAKAIALSLKESENKPARSTSLTTTVPTSFNPAQVSTSSTSNRQLLYPNFSNGPTTQPAPSNTAVAKGRVRALYDFEAAEDNELTFKAGELIVLLDDSDENWWRGSNHRGEGLFPAQFVKIEPEDGAPHPPTTTSAPGASSTSTSLKTTVQLDAGKLDECLQLINLVDPTGEFRPDPPELAQLEAECNAMAPLVDPELEKVDKRVMMLSDLNQRLLDAFQMYHDLMSRPTMPQHPPGTSATAVGYYVPGQTAAAYLGAYGPQAGVSIPYPAVGQDGMQPPGLYNNPSVMSHPSSMHPYATAADAMYASVPGQPPSMHFGPGNSGTTVPASTATTGQGAVPTPAMAGSSGAGVPNPGLAQSHHYYPMMSDGSMNPNMGAHTMQTAAGYGVPDPYTGRYAPVSEPDPMHSSDLPSYTAATQQMNTASATHAPNPYYYGYAPSSDNPIPDGGQQYAPSGVPVHPTNPTG